MKILLAVDGSKYAEAAVRECCRIIMTGSDTEIKILSVAEISRPVGIEPFGVSSDFHLTINDEIKNFAEKAVKDARQIVTESLGDKATLDTKIMSGSPKSAIVEEAENWGADLIVVGSHGYGFFDRILIGSVSDAVLHHAPCSVLVVKTKQTDNQ